MILPNYLMLFSHTGVINNEKADVPPKEFAYRR